jgi:hypothetical protein
MRPDIRYFGHRVGGVDFTRVSNKFKWLRGFWLGFTRAAVHCRLAAADSYGLSG